MKNFSNPETEMVIQTEKTFKIPKIKEQGKPPHEMLEWKSY